MKCEDQCHWLVIAFLPLILSLLILIPLHLIHHYNFFELAGICYSFGCTLLVFYHGYEFIHRNWLGFLLGMSTNLKKLGEWAVVTGATDGIGKAYALALARRGLNVVLISRSPQNLAKVANELETEHGVQTKVVAADFTDPTIYEEIGTSIQDLDVGILVNNVGMSYPYPEYYADVPGGPKFKMDMINCNILSMAMMTSIVLPGMLERKRGAIINLGSISSNFDTPFMSLYAATKAFAAKFTRDLCLEYKDQGILFQCLTPGYVVSNMSKVRESTWFVPGPNEFVEKALKMVGIVSETAVWIPHQLLSACVTIGHFFRRKDAAMVSHRLLREFWLFGKKRAMIRARSKDNYNNNNV